MSTGARVGGVRPPGIPRESWLRRKTIKSEAARRVREVTDNRTNEQPAVYGNTLKRDGEVIGTFKSWLDCFAAAQAMSAAYKRARFDAEGAMGQHFTYRKGARSRKDEQR